MSPNFILFHFTWKESWKKPICGEEVCPHHLKLIYNSRNICSGWRAYSPVLADTVLLLSLSHHFLAPLSRAAASPVKQGKKSRAWTTCPLFFCIFNWRIIALQCCKVVYGLCHVSPWISRKYTYVSSLFEPPSHPISPLDVVPEHQVELPVLYSNFPLALYFTHGNAYVSVLLSQFVSPSPASTVSSVFSMSVSLFLPCK